MRRLLLATALIVLVLVWVAASKGAAATTRTEYMPCAGNDTERNCVWDNRHGGEGDGFSFSFFVAPNGWVYRLPHHIAHRLIYGR
jgi:hypothetical protein